MLSESIFEMIIFLESKLQAASETGEKVDFSLKEKVLFLLSRSDVTTPAFLIAHLGVIKSNLATLMTRLVASGEVEVMQGFKDKRSIAYRISEKGQKTINDKLSAIKIDAKNEKEIKDAINRLIKLFTR